MQAVSVALFDERNHNSRLGAAVALTVKGPRLIMPRGFLRRWHCAALPEPRDLDGVLPALSDLVIALRDPFPSTRWRVVESLRRAGPPAEALPFLIERLQSDPCRSVRWRAAEALSAPSFPATTVAKALIEASADRDEWVRWHAHRVLRYAVKSDVVLSMLPHYATGANAPATRAYAIAYLGARPILPTKLLRDLAERLWDEDVDVRRRAVEVFVRHPLPSDRRAELGLRLCLEDAEPRLRERAVRAIARLRIGSQTLLQSALADPAPIVRSAVCEALGGERTNKRWLRHALDDLDLTVRASAAKALAARSAVDQRVVETLGVTVASLSPLDTLDAWRSLLASAAACERSVTAAISAIPPRRLYQVIAEDVAADVLPTIGVRLWPAKAQIRYPNKEGGDRLPIALGYPWVDLGVCRSWETHHPPQRAHVRGIVKQVCFAAQPFALAHLVAAVEFSRHIPDHFDGSRAPIHIEGRPVASIIEGGNATPNLQRLDFVFADDLRFCQYATFGGLCSTLNHPTSFQRMIVGEWRMFCERMSEILADARLTDFLQVSWFDPAGWQSSRYGRRHERSYAEVREGLSRLLRMLRSRAGRKRGESIQRVAEEYAENVELALWGYRLRRYPEPILRLLGSGAAGGRVARYVEQTLT